MHLTYCTVTWMLKTNVPKQKFPFCPISGKSKQHLWMIALNREQLWLWYAPSLCMLHPKYSAFGPDMQNWSSMQSQQLLPDLAVLEETT